MKELFIGIFIMTAPMTSNAGNEQDAYHAAAEASYKESGLEDMVNHYVEKQLKHVPEVVKTTVGDVFLVGKTIQERRLSYTWSF